MGNRVKGILLMVILILNGILLSACGSGTAVKTEGGSAAAGGGAGEESADPSSLPDNLTFGVSVYNTQDAEVQAFRSYFEDYLSRAFDVKFLYSGSLERTEEEIQFIEELHARNVPGIISFLSTDLDTVLTKCDELGMYYLRGSGSVSQQNYEKARNHESFLGIIGPSEEMEQKAGYEMASYFARRITDENVNFLILSGGGSIGNQMHGDRTEGMLNALKIIYRLSYSSGAAAEMAFKAGVTEVETGNDRIHITIVPGYLRDGTVSEKLKGLLKEKKYDVVMGALAVNNVIADIEEAENRDGNNILVGTIDSFTEQNYNWFRKKDVTGDTTLNYVTGKYCAAVGPAFAAMYNACTGEADFLKPDGKGSRFYMPFWTADNYSTFEKLYDQSVNIYDNIYSARDLRSVIRVFNPNASYEDFKALTEREQIKQ